MLWNRSSTSVLQLRLHGYRLSEGSPREATAFTVGEEACAKEADGSSFAGYSSPAPMDREGGKGAAQRLHLRVAVT